MNGDFKEEYITRSGWIHPVVVRIGNFFKDIVVKMSGCRDTVVVEIPTHQVKDFVNIQTGGGDETIELRNRTCYV